FCLDPAAAWGLGTLLQARCPFPKYMSSRSAVDEAADAARWRPEWPMQAWEWHRAVNRKWVPYNTEVSAALEKLYQDKFPEFDREGDLYKFRGANRQLYVVDLSAFKQRNLGTKAVRDVRRRAARPAPLWESRRGAIESAGQAGQAQFALSFFEGSWRNWPEPQESYAAAGEPPSTVAGTETASGGGGGDEALDVDDDVDEDSDSDGSPKHLIMASEGADEGALKAQGLTHECYTIEYVADPQSRWGFEYARSTCSVPGWYMTHDYMPDYAERYVLDVARSASSGEVPKLVWVCVWQEGRQNGYPPSDACWCFEADEQAWWRSSA
ncbi:unnamed protein product, partial [Prorocentrum cordatum]